MNQKMAARKLWIEWRTEVTTPRYSPTQWWPRPEPKISAAQKRLACLEAGLLRDIGKAEGKAGSA